MKFIKNTYKQQYYRSVSEYQRCTHTVLQLMKQLAEAQKLYQDARASVAEAAKLMVKHE
jgi:uncharacterized protein YukE